MVTVMLNFFRGAICCTCAHVRIIIY